MASTDLQGTTALVIDGLSLSRSVTVGLLNDIGVGVVFQAARPEDGRRMMETQVFDFVFCDYDFPGTPMTGQALLDDLRASRLLPLSTVFFMITGEASYTKVAEAVESALDNYLLKPYSPSALAQRVRDCRERKVILKRLFDAMDAERFAEVVSMCEALVAVHARYWQFAARIGAELALQLGAWPRARQLYEGVLAAQYSPWARLGLAHASSAAGQPEEARRTLEALIAASPAYVDAYHALGRLHLANGAHAEALAALRMATQLTPGSLSRLLDHGRAAFLSHQFDEAAAQLERAVALGVYSKQFDTQALMLLGLLKFDGDDSPALRRYRDILQSLHERTPGDYRLLRFAELFEVLRLLLLKKTPGALEGMQGFAGHLGEPAFDFDLACDFLATLDRIVGAQVEVHDYAAWAAQLALRFCDSRATTDILHRFVDVVEGEDAINQAYAEVDRLAQNAAASAARGEAPAAVGALIAFAEQTRNARITELATLIIRRHEGDFPDADALLARVAALSDNAPAPASD